MLDKNKYLYVPLTGVLYMGKSHSIALRDDLSTQRYSIQKPKNYSPPFFVKSHYRKAFESVKAGLPKSITHDEAFMDELSRLAQSHDIKDLMRATMLVQGHDEHSGLFRKLFDILASQETLLAPQKTLQGSIDFNSDLGRTALAKRLGIKGGVIPVLVAAGDVVELKEAFAETTGDAAPVAEAIISPEVEPVECENAKAARLKKHRLYKQHETFVSKAGFVRDVFEFANTHLDADQFNAFTLVVLYKGRGVRREAKQIEEATELSYADAVQLASDALDRLKEVADVQSQESMPDFNWAFFEGTIVARKKDAGLIRVARKRNPVTGTGKQAGFASKPKLETRPEEPSQDTVLVGEHKSGDLSAVHNNVVTMPPQITKDAKVSKRALLEIKMISLAVDENPNSPERINFEWARYGFAQGELDYDDVRTYSAFKCYKDKLDVRFDDTALPIIAKVERVISRLQQECASTPEQTKALG